MGKANRIRKDIFFPSPSQEPRPVEKLFAASETEAKSSSCHVGAFAEVRESAMGVKNGGENLAPDLNLLQRFPSPVVSQVVLPAASTTDEVA